MITYNEDYPIVLGLAGKAGTGKTSVAESMVPKAAINVSHNKMVWDHIFFALPLYEMASIKKTIAGISQRNRQLYALHSVVYDVFGGNPIGNMPNYEHLIGVVRDIYDSPIPLDIKPRTFLQTAGDICRAVDPDCFARWGVNKANKLHREYLRAAGEAATLPFGVIISDVRFINEAEQILSHPNGILVCYEASDEVREQRLFDRDGYHMSEKQKAHKSEQQIDTLRDMADIVINTDILSVQGQTDLTFMEVYDRVGLNAEAS